MLVLYNSNVLLFIPSQVKDDRNAAENIQELETVAG